ncbi:DUF3455 domain-containing protein [Cupriavidus sp. CuC1]|uniref:DUF3455 domain-containing protein n=1 Tax=Cupriavidus sp. CuC1 TaxID=3373131 RepID=UPI0037D3B617
MWQDFRSSRKSHRIALAGACLLASCAIAQETAPPELQPADARRTIATLHASGVQIYVCKRDQGNSLAWAFKSPEADLHDASGKLIAKHYAGPTWEAPDGSKVTGKVLRQAANARAPDSIALLLLQATSSGGTGLLAAVHYVQRLNTQGGLAPAQACTQEGQESRVPYRADYIFLE